MPSLKEMIEAINLKVLAGEEVPAEELRAVIQAQCEHRLAAAGQAREKKAAAAPPAPIDAKALLSQRFGPRQQS
jgi:hypothetical protein